MVSGRHVRTHSVIGSLARHNTHAHSAEADVARARRPSIARRMRRPE
jgi:hypothetical protein